MFARHLLLPLVFSACVAQAQVRTSTPRPNLQEELCTCMSAIPTNSDDRRFEVSVRTCLEDGVLHHTGEVLRLLERYPERSDKAFLLGLILGGSMEGRCAGFDLVKARLQQLPSRIPNDRKGT